MSHTPGPWAAQDTAVFSGKNCIAVSDTDNDTHERYAANARLIAAAPDLLEALRNFRDFAQESPGLGLRWKSIVQTAEAAIAKAEDQK